MNTENSVFIAMRLTELMLRSQDLAEKIKELSSD